MHDGRFVALMNYEAGRAEEFYREAEQSLGRQDRRAMLAAEVMREIYGGLLKKMRKDGFRVFDRRYGLSKARKVAIFSKHLLKARARGE